MEKPPVNKTAGDAAYEIGRAIASAIPTVGGPLAALFENIFTAPLEKRKREWLERLAGVISELQEKVEGLTPEELAKNEVFISVAMQASQIAVRNHQEEKLEALRNAVLNSALPDPPEENQQLTFLHLIDRLTPWHIRILAWIDNPEGWMRKHNISNPGWRRGSLSTVLEHCLPELRGKQEFYELIVRDLQAAGLVNEFHSLHTLMTGDGMLASRTSAMGKSFLRFISDPE